MTRVVMAESSDIHHDYRVQKEAASLAAAGYEVTVRGFRATAREPRDRSFPFRLRTLPVVSRRHRKLRNLSMVLAIALINLRLPLTRARFYHAHNTMFLAGMWLASRLHGGRFIYDAHEVQWEVGGVHALLERLFIRRADGIVNVARGRAEICARRYGLPLSAFTIVPNYPQPDRRDELPTWAPVPGRLRLVYAGGYDLRNQRLDLLLRAMGEVDGVELHLLAFGYGDSEQRLRALVAELGLEDRVRHLPLVSPAEVMRTIAPYDMAVNLLTNPQDHVAIRYASANKAYEYLAAGLPTLCSDLEIFREELEAPGAAVAVDADDVGAIAAALRGLREGRHDLERMRRVAAELSRERFNWSLPESALLGLYRDLQRRSDDPAPRTVAPGPGKGQDRP